MPDKQVITAERAPKAIGPYSAAIRHGSMIFTSGQIGVNPQTGELAPGGVAAQTRQALQNLQTVLEAAGASLGVVVKTTVFLSDIQDYGKVNGIYAEFFDQKPPARSAVQVAALPKGAAVEIEAIAISAEE
jgi:2-iminobutanoate/2-iminopropanoate deaminase